MAELPYISLPSLPMVPAVTTAINAINTVQLVTVPDTKITTTAVPVVNITCVPPTPIKTVGSTIPTVIPATAVPIVSTVSSRSNIVGFEDSNWYKIRNVGDNNVIEVDSAGNKLICMPEDNEKNDVQKFRAIKQQTGEYRIMARFQKSPSALQVWDYLRHRQLLIQRKESATDKWTQKYVSEHVPGYNSLYLIQSGPNPESPKCLKNMGSGQQIKLVDKSAECVGDNFVHWVLDLQDVPNS